MAIFVGTLKRYRFLQDRFQLWLRYTPLDGLDDLFDKFL